MLLNLKTWFAHEVYVLSPQQIAGDEHAHKVRVWDTLHFGHNLRTFTVYGLVVTASLALSLWLKSRPFFKKVGGFIDQATVFAPDLIRVVFGASLIFSARHQAVFGPELPIDSFSYHQLIGPFLYVSGLLLILGLGTRLFGLLTAAFWLLTLADRGWYMLTYLNYFGEALALVLLRRQNFALDRFISGKRAKTGAADRWAMPLTRIFFGLALLYAAINVKFVTAALSLDVVNRYELTRYFHFDPLFVVLGAGLIESLIAVLYILGLLNRLNSLMFIGFVAVSIWFFKETVWPHYLLLGLAAGIFLHKPDFLAVDGRLFNRHKRPARLK